MAIASGPSLRFVRVPHVKEHQQDLTEGNNCVRNSKASAVILKLLAMLEMTTMFLVIGMGDVKFERRGFTAQLLQNSRLTTVSATVC